MVLLVLLLTTLDGILIWLLWPYTIPLIFPGLVSSGAIAGVLSLKTSILFFWLLAILFGAGRRVSKK
jgi:hypothetical protein